jgi:antitoxin component YwqK of YwqJK toxin-antitoxin module
MKYVVLCFCYFVSGDKITTDQSKATSYGIYGKLSTEDLWVIKRYDLWDNLIESGSYKDEQLSIPHGNFNYYMEVAYFNVQYGGTFYLKNKLRFNFQQGSFVDGLAQGRWTFFFPDGNILNIHHFIDGKLDGEYKTYNKLGELVENGNYKKGEMDGEWFFENGKLKKVYENGVLKSSEIIKKAKRIKGTISN